MGDNHGFKLRFPKSWGYPSNDPDFVLKLPHDDDWGSLQKRTPERVPTTVTSESFEVMMS